MSPMTAAPVSDFPAPDSPTTSSTSHKAVSNETSCSSRYRSPRRGRRAHEGPAE
jgi:hypothetical protein